MKAALTDQFLDEPKFLLSSPEKLGVSKSYSTLRSWHMNGLVSKITGETVFLEAMYEGGTLVTSREAVKRFHRRLNGVKE